MIKTSKSTSILIVMKYWDQLTWTPIKFWTSLIVLLLSISTSDWSSDSLTKYLKSVPVIFLSFNCFSISSNFHNLLLRSMINFEGTSNGWTGNK